jgi:hypothetical protein
MLPENGFNLPDMNLHGVGAFGGTTNPFLVNLLVESKNSKPNGISFGVLTSSHTIWKDGDIMRPIMVEIKTNAIGHSEISFTPEDLKKLQQ